MKTGSILIYENGVSKLVQVGLNAKLQVETEGGKPIERDVYWNEQHIEFPGDPDGATLDKFLEEIYALGEPDMTVYLNATPGIYSRVNYDPEAAMLYSTRNLKKLIK